MKSALLIHPDEITEKWIDRAKDAGVCTLGIHPKGGIRAPKNLSELLEVMKTEKFRALIDYAKARGLAVEYEFHAAGYLLPRELFSSHPEYFRVDAQGKRTNDWNFCVSNEDSLSLFAKRAAELALSLYGSEPNFYFWMDDRKDTHCMCDKCRSLSPSDQQLIAVNAMAREIKKYIPNAKVAYLAYMDSIVLPKCVTPEENVFLEYAPFEKYTARGEDAPALIEREKKMLLPLLDFFGKDGAKVLEYWYDNSMYSGWEKPPKKFTLDEAAMDADIAYYRELGFENISSFACFLGEDYEQLYGEIDISAFGKNF
jgi:hypothetical protein